MYTMYDWTINCPFTCQGLEQSKARVKPQSISPPVSCPCTDCNSLCGLEAEPKREPVILRQHNKRETFSVARGSAVPAVLQKSEKVSLLL